MKIKTGLLISFFVVMILPLLSAYFLFAWVTNYQNDKKVEEYYEAYSEIQMIKNILEEDASLYETTAAKEKVDDLTSDDVSIILYNADGIKLYSSNPNLDYQHSVGKDELYQNLYDIQEGLTSFIYREPVFDDGQLIGFFDIEIARNELISTIIKRGWIVIGLFIASFVLIYVAISFAVNNRLTKRLYGLMDEMSAFASGNTFVETETGKDEIGELKEHFYSMRKQITAAQELIKTEQKAKEWWPPSLMI